MSDASHVPVLLIVGSGRSGSTLLDRVIGTDNDFCSVGELRFVWERSFVENQLCGCGSPFHDCDFWREVSEHVFGTEPARARAAAATRLRRSLDELRRAPWLVQPCKPRSVRRELSAYGWLLEALYEGIRRASGARVIVDSSCDATHGHILARVPGVELHVLHLVRDPRAVAFSWQRARRRPEIHWSEADMPTLSARTSSARWLAQNLLGELLARAAASYTRIRYEDLAGDPGATLSRALGAHGWARGADSWTDAGEVVLRPAHTVSGNPMRFRNGRVAIALDDEWRAAMSRADRRRVTTITWPLLTRYGYPLRARRAPARG